MQDIQINSIDTLAYEWQVEDMEANILYQDYNTPQEKTFKDIEEFQNKYGIAFITLKPNDSNYPLVIMDMFNGNIQVDKTVINFDLKLTVVEDGNIRKVQMNELKLRPIIFRRIRRNYSPNGEIVTVKFAIGFQTTYNNISYKRYIFINEDKTITVISE